ncbi:MAG: PAS domain S-box protein [Opitutus sp.]|nr:PAS domain S-box protein [Opitutus sp.]MCS6246720.1 PAS domain S-box protein [Opitutus sp.]MCS6274910.1 PAS domain S-box protein [Opitutus sp.]MCS6274912.1 PAS domain S-box protein [Opitutus sp.]MCS6277284.1 PAS domain S-box protein [Opitutus sp.]
MLPKTTPSAAPSSPAGCATRDSAHPTVHAPLAPALPLKANCGTRGHARLRGASLPIVSVILIGLGLSVAATWWTEQVARSRDFEYFNHLGADLKAEIHRCINHSENGLRGARSLWPASKSVERGEFTAMIAERNLAEEFPGALGVGFIRRVPRANLAEFLVATRADDAPGFQLKSQGDAAELYVVEFIHPLAPNAAAEGFDFAQDPRLRAAAEHAMRSGEIAFTPPLLLNPQDPSSKGVFMIFPVYRNGSRPATADERSAALLGWTYLPVSASRLLASLTSGLSEQINFDVLGGPDRSQPVFQTGKAEAGASAPTAHAPRGFHRVIPLQLRNESWELSVTPSTHFEATSRLSVYSAALIGPILTLLVAGLLLSYQRTSQKARALAEAMTADLAEAKNNAEQLALVATRTTNAVVFTDAQRRITWVNDGFVRITGYTAREAIGKKPGDFLQSVRTDPATIRAMRAAFDRGMSFQGDICNQRKDGQDYWVNLDVIPLHDELGQLTGFMATKLDITASKLTADRLEIERQRAEAALTDLRRTESELQQKASRLALANQVGGIGIWEWDVRTNTLLWDATMRSIFGLPPDALVNSYASWADALHPDDRAKAYEELKDAVAGIRPFDTEFRISWPDGAVHHLRARAIVQRDEHGQPLKMIGVNWDITELKNSQERLQLFSRAVEQSPASVVITNTRGDIEYVNDKFTRLTGYSRAEVLGKNPRVLKSGETSPEAYFELWATLSRGEPWSGVFHNMNKAGQLYWEAATITPIKTDAGVITHYLASKEDITERRAAEAALRHERWLLNCLMETVPALIYFKDNESRFIQVNQALATFVGAEPATILGRTDFDFYQAADAAKCADDEASIRQTGRPIIDQIEQITQRNGTRRWFSTSKLPLRNAAGIITGTFGLSTDITVQKRSDEERATLQIQLTQSQKLESIGMLAAGIAHEINTPSQFVTDNLAYVTQGVAKLDPVLEAHPRLLAALHASGPLAPDVAEWLATLPNVKLEVLRRELPSALADAHDGMVRITQIVRAMKSYSHRSGDALTASDLNQAIENTLIVCRNEWKYVADMQTHLDPALPAVPCHLGDFNQVIVNLVVNAAHSIGDVVAKTPGSKGVITVSTRVAEGWAEVRVADTGAGIPESARSHIFTPFFTTKQVGKGTGQGLALARSVIVDRHKGTLSFETELGRGTTFFIRIPLVAVVEAGAANSVIGNPTAPGHPTPA